MDGAPRGCSILVGSHWFWPRPPPKKDHRTTDAVTIDDGPTASGWLCE